MVCNQDHENLMMFSCMTILKFSLSANMNCNLLSQNVVRFALLCFVLIDSDAMLLKFESPRMVVFKVVLCFYPWRLSFRCCVLSFGFHACAVFRFAFCFVCCVMLRISPSCCCCHSQCCVVLDRNVCVGITYLCCFRLLRDAVCL